MIAAGMDIRTLIIALLAQVSLLGTLAIYFESRQPGTRAMGTWGAGLIVVAAGYALIALRGAIPDLMSITVANTLLMGANLIFYRSLRIFGGRSVYDPLGLGALAATTTLIYVFSEVAPNLGLRVVSVSAISGLLFLRNALELRCKAPPEVRVSRRFMESVYWLVVALMVFRVGANLYSPGVDLMAPSLSQSVFFLVVLLLTTAGSFGMFWMEIQYLHLDLTRQAARDSLTGLLNRRAFLAEFSRELARARRGGTVLGVAMFDLDHFKRLNDQYGHPAGDEVLRSVASTMQSTLRHPDIIGRYGGEEFALLMPDTDSAMAMQVAGRIRAAVQMGGVEWNGQRLSITLSGGIAAFPAQGTTAESLIAASDAALYEAKRAGRNRIEAAPASGIPVDEASGIHATP